ncbi:MAG TPA: hypothetical protein VF377_08800 [Acidimicrobiia bacterium]
MRVDRVEFGLSDEELLRRVWYPGSSASDLGIEGLPEEWEIDSLYPEDGEWRFILLRRPA